MHPEEEPILEEAMYRLDLGHRLARNPFIPAPECVVCGDELRGDRRPIKINEYYCCPACFDLPGGFRSQFEAFVRPGIQQRPKFGDKDIDFEGCCWKFSPAFNDAFKHKLGELKYLPENRLYCARDGCAKFLGPRDGALALAHHVICSCRAKTCPKCDAMIEDWNIDKMRRPEHKCMKKDSVEKALEGLKRGRDYQFCPGCHWLIELSEACNHMTCRYNCGTQFCYLCGQRAKKKSGHWAQGASCPLYGPPNGPNPLYEPEDDEDSEDDDEDEDDEEDEDGNEDNDPAPDGDVPDNNPNEDRGEDGEAPDHQPGRGHDADGQPPIHDAHDPPQNHDAGDHAPPHDIMDEAPFQEVHPPEHELDDGFEQANGQNFDANDPDQQADGLNGVDRAPEQRMIEDDGQEGGNDAFIDDLWENGEEEDHQEEEGMFAPQFAGMFEPPRVLSIAERIEVLIMSVSVYRMNQGMPWYLVHDITGPNQDPPEGAQASIFSWFRRKDRHQLRDMYVDLQQWALQRMPGPFLLGMHALAYVIRRLLLGLDYYTIHEIDHLGERGNFRMYLAHSHPLADYVFGLMPNQANLRYPTLSRIIATYRMAKTGNIENLRGWLRQRMWTPGRENVPHIDRRHSLDSIALSLAMERAQPGERAPNQVVPQ